MTGRVVGIFVTPTMGGRTESRESARALARRGLEGDRYASGQGFYTREPAPAGARQLTLIEAEILDAVFEETGIRLDPDEQRRNIITRGVGLNALIGKQFRIGDVSCIGVMLCEPCARLVELTGKNVLRPLVHRGGLRAAILSDGLIRVGDVVAPMDLPGGPL